jgi:hypothetical protein
MKQEITLTGFIQDPNSGAIEVGYLWNEFANSQVYSSEAEMLTAHADLLQEPSDAVRWLMYYLIAMGNDAASMNSMVGRKLIIDVAPAVQQTIALV